MEAPFNPKQILQVLTKHGVNFVVLGGIAGTIHGSPLPTSDVDICPALDNRNLQRLAEALKELDAKMMATAETEGLPLDWTEQLLRKSLLEIKFVNLITKHGQLDLLYRPAGTEGFKDLSRRAVAKHVDGEIEVRIAALGDVIRSKQAAGRQRDLEQLPTLRKLLEMTESEQGG
jgi:predicted nucleotidyltransferase